MKRELLIGCGAVRDKRIKLNPDEDWKGLVTLDMNAVHRPNIIADLNELPYDWSINDAYDEIHAYEVLEHTGQQGDWKFFFAQFSEFYRILKPDGLLCGTSPGPSSPWLWGDPGHTRSISKECFVFLNQTEYTKQVGKTPMTDYRFVYQADFELIYFSQTPEGTIIFILQAKKPSRSTYETGRA